MTMLDILNPKLFATDSKVPVYLQHIITYMKDTHLITKNSKNPSVFDVSVLVIVGSLNEIIAIVGVNMLVVRATCIKLIIKFKYRHFLQSYKMCPS